MDQPRGLEELTRYKMCMAIAVSHSQEEGHRILSLSTEKKKPMRVEVYLQVHVHFLKRRWCQDGVKHHQRLKGSHSDPICFPQSASAYFSVRSRHLDKVPTS